MLINPTEQQIIDDMISYLSLNTSITNFDDGSIAKGLVIAFAKQLYKQYQIFKIRGAAGYLSTSTGMYLDMMGELVNCTRFTSETDDNYRYRIAHQIQIVASSNETAIKFRCLAIDGVKNVVVKKFARGIGTFDVYILTDDPVTPADILSEAQSVIDDAAAMGISGYALSPAPIPIDMKIKLISNKTITQSMKKAVEFAVKTYIDSIELGGTMIIDQVTKAIMNASSDIIEFDYNEIKINGRFISPINYSASSDERLYLRGISIV
ncbi:MAG TPA: baseplate J/gp47 family protein [Pseudoneobacillus sp.]|jgi:hypothetical protein|nr:baseplate J/gp47 family protein [Pseudoneobacillus sp.]